MNAQPISTAPRDGTPILTNSGVVQWMWGREMFVLCTPNGRAMRDLINGFFQATPSQWTPLPDWMKS